MTKLPVASDTMLKAFENCPHKGFRLYVSKDVKRVYKTSNQSRGIDAHKALSMFITRGRELPKEFKHYAHLASPLCGLGALTELPLAIDRARNACGFFDDGVFLRGYGDVVIIKDDTAVLFDWKDAKKREDPGELRLHALMLKARYPNLKKITGHYVWLRNVGTEFPVLGHAHDLSDTEATWMELEQQIDEIEHMLLQNHFPKQPNPLCGWCDVIDCEHNKNEEAKRAQTSNHSQATAIAR
jgi:hypothetical protein